MDPMSTSSKHQATTESSSSPSRQPPAVSAPELATTANTTNCQQPFTTEHILQPQLQADSILRQPQHPSSTGYYSHISHPHLTHQSLSHHHVPSFQQPTTAVLSVAPTSTRAGLFKPYEVTATTNSPVAVSINVNMPTNETNRNGSSDGHRKENVSESSGNNTTNNNEGGSWGFNILPPSLQDSLHNLPNLPTLPSFPNLPSLPSNILKNTSNLTQNMMPNISDYLPTNFTSISQHMPRMSIPSMPSMPSLPNFSLPTIPSLPTLMSFRQQKSWNELKEAVRIAHRRLGEVSNRVPFAFSFRPLEVTIDSTDPAIPVKKIGGIRLYFLCPSALSSETTLHYCDVYDGPEGDADVAAFLLTQYSSSTVNLDGEERSLHPRIDLSSSLSRMEKTGSSVSLEAMISEDAATDLAGSKVQEDQPTGSEVHHPEEGHQEDAEEEEEDDCTPIITGLLSPKSSSQPSSQQPPRPPRNTRSQYKTFSWKPLIESTFKRSSNESDNDLNLEEKLLLERKRMMLSGITSYEYDYKSRRFVFTSGYNLFYFDDIEGENPPYQPIKVDSNVKAAKMNPQINQWNPDLVAFVAEGNLYVTNLKTGQEVKLTDVSGAVAAGQPSYVIQEEFRRYIGFWWRPNQTGVEESCGKQQYTLLYEEVDESMVDIVKIPSYDGVTEEYRFPRPGDVNAVHILKLVSFTYDTEKSFINNQDVKCQSLPDLRETVNPEYEYLVRAGWYNHDVYWVQLLNRKQNQLDLAFFSLSGAFPPQIILREVSQDYWVNVTDVLNFLEVDHSKENSLKVGSLVNFIWSSEETGFRHLYSVTVELTDEERNNGVSPQDNQMEGINDHHILQSILREKVQLTSGNWEVSERDVWVDEPNQLIYFVSTKEIPIERHLYVTSLIPSQNSSSSPLKRLTDSGFCHSYISFDPTFKYYVNVQSNISIPPFGFVHKIKDTLSNSPTPIQENSNQEVPMSTSVDSPTPLTKRRVTRSNSDFLPRFKKLGFIVDNPYVSTMEPPPATTNALLTECVSINDHVDVLPGCPKPELFTYQLKDSGGLVYGVIFKPDFMENGVKYPCLLDVYGGPEVQIVTNSFKSMRNVRRHLLASEGYIIVAFDCRGSHHRGKKFEGHLFKKMGQVEIADQVEVLTWLAETTGYIDMKRIAVHGWSYGGYLSLMALAQRPDIFKVAIAGAPVCKWTLYDTGYTERYMDTPENNPDGYEKGSVLSYINNFPDEENRLLVIHGLKDENVHFIHSAELINALIRAGKPYQLQVYPSERHSLRNSSCGEHYESYLLSYLQQHL